MLRVLTCLSLVACAVVTASARAESAEAPGPERAPAPASDDQLEQQKAEARRRFLAGLELARQSAWEAALAEFLASIELFRTRAALTNAAICRRQLGRYVEAERTYQTLLDGFADAMSEQERKEAEASRDEARSHIGAISAASEPTGAVVVVDGQQSGVTPLAAPVPVDPGAHSVRIFKPGYAALEASVVVNSRQTSDVRVSLQQISQLGTLAVREASSRRLRVLIDGALVGETPWTGTLPPGAHSVALQGEAGLGSAPSAASIVANQSTSLVLAAALLDSEVRVEPVPSNARVGIDGVPVGNGVWQGRMPSGRHRVEVAAEGHVTVERALDLKPGRRETLRIGLVRALPAGPAPFTARLYAEFFGGVAWAPSFGADADASCSKTLVSPEQVAASGCVERSRPFGYAVGARLGYPLAPHLAVEVSLGYLRLSEQLTRRVYVDHETEQDALYSDDYHDATTIAGPMAAASVAYRFSDTVPVTVRAWLGVARLHVQSENRGTYRGDVSAHDTDYPIENQQLSILEQSQDVFAPFFGPEVRIGYRLTKNLVVDAGVAALLLVSGATPRTDAETSRVEGHRTGPLPDPNGTGNLGLIELPMEQSLGTAFTLLPNAAVRWEF